MIKFCLKKWEQNKGLLEKELRTRTDLNTCDYDLLVKLVVHNIFNDGETENHYDFGGAKYDPEKITEIDNGDYQGTLLFLIPSNNYQPSESEYLMTYVGYGSCCGCDTLQGIQDWGETVLTENQVKDFMDLCRGIVQNTIKPYNHGWRWDDEFDPVEEDNVRKENPDAT